jgi:hypothetical protein
MNFIKRSPLAFLVLFIMLGIFAGTICADLSHQRMVEGMYRRGLISTPYYPKEEGYYAYMLIYGFMGGMISFAIGITGYIIITRSDTESLSALNLGNRDLGK